MLGTLKRPQIIKLLESQTIGRLGCCNDDFVYIVPITYVYKDGNIYGHTTIGLKTKMTKTNPHVCFEVDHLINMANWESAICWGYFEELEGDEALKGMKIFLSKLAYQMTSVTSQPLHGIFNERGEMSDREFKGFIFKITISKMTGRFENR